VKEKNKVKFYDTLVILNSKRLFLSYSFGSSYYKTYDRLYYNDTLALANNKYKFFLSNYFLVCGKYALDGKFIRYFIRRKDLVICKEEICYFTDPFCPLSIIYCKNDNGAIYRF
jgi:hypothetical protein